MTEKDRTPEEIAKAAPLNFGPGAFEMSDLEAATKKIVAAKPAERDAVAAAELAAVNQRLDTPEDASLLPGHKFVERDVVLVEGTKVKGEKEPVGEVKVTETIQVFDPAKAEEEATAAEEATGGVDVAGAGTAAASAPAAAAKD